MQKPTSPRQRVQAAVGLTVAAGLAATGFTVANASDGDGPVRATKGHVLVAARAEDAPDAYGRAWFDQVGEYVEAEAARQYAVAEYGRALDWQAAAEYAEAVAALPAAPGDTSGGGSTMAAIRACESGGDYRALSPSGTYRGAYQFDQQTWESVGGSGDPAAASPAEQDMRAGTLYE